MSQQKVRGDVGQMIGRDMVVNYNNVALGETAEPMAHSQRVLLDALIEDIANLTNVDKKQVWHRLHTAVNVNNTRQITTKKFQWAEEFLLFELDKAKEIKDRHLLIGKIQEITNTHEKQSVRNNFCLKIFGTHELSHLNREQLQSVYYLMDFGLPVCEHDCADCKSKAASLFQSDHEKKLTLHEIARYSSLMNNVFFL